jgi:hypothetical protein
MNFKTAFLTAAFALSLGAHVDLATHEPVPDRMAGAQAQEAGGPQTKAAENPWLDKGQPDGLAT